MPHALRRACARFAFVVLAGTCILVLSFYSIVAAESYLVRRPVSGIGLVQAALSLLTELDDVDSSMSPGTGDVLTHDGTQWTAAAPAPAFSGYQQVAGTPVNIAPGGEYGIATADCPSGKILTGGGCYCNGQNLFYLTRNRPNSSTQWYCAGENHAGSTTRQLTAYAICVDEP